MTLRLLLAVIAALSLPACFRETTQLTILFDNAHDLEIGTKVYNRGLALGEVTSLAIAGNKIAAVITLDEDYKIPADSKFILGKSIVGVSSIDIQAAKSRTFLSPGDTVAGVRKETHWLDSLVADSAKQQKIRESLHKIADGIHSLAQAAKDTTISKPK